MNLPEEPASGQVGEPPPVLSVCIPGQSTPSGAARDGSQDGASQPLQDADTLRQPDLQHERLLAELDRRAAETASIINAIADGLVIYAPDGSIVRMNDSLQSMLGFESDHWKKPPAERFSRLKAATPAGDPIPIERTPASRAIRGEKIAGEVVVIKDNRGRRIWVSESAAPIRAPDGSIVGAVVTLTDITALHELQERHDDMLRAVSHDLRNPLTVAHGEAHNLLRSALTDGQRESVEAISQAVRRMSSMIRDIVDSVRSERGELTLQKRLVDLAAFIEQTTAGLAGVLETDRVSVEPPLEPVHVPADCDHLERIITNLLSNALKYAPGSDVAVRIGKFGREAVVSVCDHGPGIPHADIPHLFSRTGPRHGVRRRQESLGIGLYITRLLVEAHGGRIWAESGGKVKGATFTFALPLDPASDVQRPRKRPRKPSQPRRAT